MLIDFRVRNFLSIQDEQVFSMVASNNIKDFNVNTFTNQELKLLKSSVIYGANSAGKSNLIKAITAMKIILRFSFEMGIDNKLPITPFLLGNEDDKPTKFEINFFIGEIRYQYGFLLDQEMIYGEWLYAYEKGNRAQRWFERRYDFNMKKPLWYFGVKLLGEKQSLARKTRDNALFLSTAVNLNNEQLRVVYNEIIHNIKLTNIKGWEDGYAVTANLCTNNKSILLKYLQAVDLDIEDIKIRKAKLNENGEKLLANAPEDVKNQLLEILNNNEKMYKIKLSHRKQNGNLVDFKIEDESDGVQKIFKILGPYLDTLSNGYVMIHDELNTHLHPIVTEFIIKLFHDKNINKKNAQLIFTTHETSLLNRNVFRKDQIWFCEKVNKASRYYSLNDFRNIRNINYEKYYLNGKFGGIPYIDDIIFNMGD